MTKNTKTKTAAIRQALGVNDEGAIVLSSSEVGRIAQTLAAAADSVPFIATALTQPPFTAFAARRHFSRSMEALSEALRELRGRFDRGVSDPELPSTTLTGEVLDTLSSYFSCVAEDGVWSAETFSGLRNNLERELSRGVTLEELAALKDHGDDAGATPTPIKHDADAIKKHLATHPHVAVENTMAFGGGEPKKSIEIAWYSPPCEMVAKKPASRDALHTASARVVAAPAGSSVAKNYLILSGEHAGSRFAAARDVKTPIDAVVTVSYWPDDQFATETPPEPTPVEAGDWAAFTKQLPKVGRWTATWDHPGAICWMHPSIQKHVFATPDWDGNGKVAVEVHEPDGKISFTNYPAWPMTGRTLDGYLAIVRPVLRGFDDVLHAQLIGLVRATERSLHDIYELAHEHDEEIGDLLTAEYPSGWGSIDEVAHDVNAWWSGIQSRINAERKEGK